eukprot:200662-Pelagomonas_calceolata.AAC.1
MLAMGLACCAVPKLPAMGKEPMGMEPIPAMLPIPAAKGRELAVAVGVAAGAAAACCGWPQGLVACAVCAACGS